MKKSVNVLGLNVKTKLFEENTNEEKLLMGYCSKSPIEIHINKSLSKQDAEHTHMHEICHAIMFRVGLDQVLSNEVQEIICETFGSFMYENMKFK